MNTKLISGIMAAMMLLGTTNMSASNKPRNDRMNDQPRQEVRIDNRDLGNIMRFGTTTAAMTTAPTRCSLARQRIPSLHLLPARRAAAMPPR